MANNWAIVIGINHYDHHPERQLKYAVPDAQLMCDFLCTHASFARDRIRLCLGDEEQRSSPNYPTYPNLLRLLNRELNPDRIGQVDRFWFFFGGHGVSQNGRDYLLTSDSLLEDIEWKIALPIDEVIASLRRHQAADIVLILDNCRQQQGSRKFVVDDVGKQTIELAQSRGITTIFSCDYGQSSYELDSLKQGAFTYALVEGLKQYTLPDKLEPYLRRRVAELNQRSDQIPRIRVEPAAKALQPLLPGAVTPADITVLVDRAREAELEESLDLAKQLWWQIVRVAKSDDWVQEAEIAIRRLDQKMSRLGSDRSDDIGDILPQSEPHQSSKPTTKSSEFSPSDTRRLDAAMPQTCKVGQRTEVRVMIALPNSAGLKSYLPDWTEAGDLISKKDAVESQFPLTFPVDSVTGKPQFTNVFISITAPDFEVEKATRNLYISPTQDSGVVTFFIMPRTKQLRGRVIVEVFEDGQKAVHLGSLTLITEIVEQQHVLTQVIWKLVNLSMHQRVHKPSITPPLPVQAEKPTLNEALEYQAINIDHARNSGQKGQAGRDALQVGGDYSRYVRHARNSGQKGQAGRDTLQVGGDYSRYVRLKWQLSVQFALISLLLFFLFLYGVKEIGVKVFKTFNATPSPAESIKIPNQK